MANQEKLTIDDGGMVMINRNIGFDVIGVIISEGDLDKFCGLTRISSSLHTVSCKQYLLRHYLCATGREYWE
jgi:hypothetical protein